MGALAICDSGRNSHCDRGSHFDYDCARNRDRIRCATGGRRLPVGGGSARRSGPVQERAPGRHRLSGGVCVSWGGKDTAVAGAGGRTRSRNGRGSRVWGRWPPAIAAATVSATVAVTTTAAAATVAAVPTVPAERAVCQSGNGHYGWLSGRVGFSQISKSDGRSEFGRCGGTACGPPLGHPSGAVTEHRFAGRRREKAHGQEGR